MNFFLLWLRLFLLLIQEESAYAGMWWFIGQLAEYLVKMEDLTWDNLGNWGLRLANAIIVAGIFQTFFAWDPFSLMIYLLFYVGVTGWIVSRTSVRTKATQTNKSLFGIVPAEAVQTVNKLAADALIGLFLSTVLAHLLVHPTYPNPNMPDVWTDFQALQRLYQMAAEVKIPGLGW